MFAALAVPALVSCLDLAVELQNEIRYRVVTTGERPCAVSRRPRRITDCGRGPAAFGSRWSPTKAQLATVALHNGSRITTTRRRGMLRRATAGQPPPPSPQDQEMVKHR